MSGEKRPNRLIHEKSPYLLQHALNPVEWYPWGEEAFARARAEDKPIFLSVGYSTCHWCHVMERESFEDPGIADLLNAHFVPIKLDREERPDIDKVYMTALQAMGQNGGWPMSMFLTPDLRPFYGGTYFPPASRYGRAGFPDVLRRIQEVWNTERDKVLESATRVHSFLRESSGSRPESGELSPSVVDRCFEQLSAGYDSVSGGFGEGPKFPRPAVFTFLFEYYYSTGNAAAREMAEHTLRSMARGGVYDHLGGGFHRYAVDAEWRVPHFEKMLYDQAQLVRAYLDAYRIAGDPLYASVARETLVYVQRDLTGVEGAFYSAEDADSRRPENPEEEGEGAFYVWTKKEIMGALGEEAEMFCFHYGAEEEGNAAVDPQLEFTGRNILYAAHAIEDTARVSHCTAEQAHARLQHARERLLDLRAMRPRPLRDEKIIVSWNGLMISAFAHAYQVLGDPAYLRSAEAAATFILTHVRDVRNGTLLRRYREGEARFNGQLEDYTHFVQALIDLYESTGDPKWLSHAVELTEQQIKLFYDQDLGGFFDTRGDDPSVLVRMKDQYDGAEPTGNSVAVANLVRLGRMIENKGWEDLAQKTTGAFSPWLKKQPGVMPNMVASFDIMHRMPRQVVLAGDRSDRRMHLLQKEIFLRYMPGLVTLYTDAHAKADPGPAVPSFVRGLPAIEGKPTAYLCENFVCRLPTNDPEELARQITNATGNGESRTGDGE